jgi:hypothetical protein
MAQGSVTQDSNGIESFVRKVNLKGFVSVGAPGEYELAPDAGSNYFKIERFVAVCTDPTGSVGGGWHLLVQPAGSDLIVLPQPKLAADLKVGDNVTYVFDTPLPVGPGSDVNVKIVTHLGTWLVGAFGYYTTIPTQS